MILLGRYDGFYMAFQTQDFFHSFYPTYSFFFCPALFAFAEHGPRVILLKIFHGKDTVT